MIEIIGAAAEYAEKVVVATFQRTEIWQVTKMPFSDSVVPYPAFFSSDGKVGWLGGRPIPLGLKGLIPTALNIDCCPCSGGD